ncbi:hypothetical protein NSP_13950 [Nodularia spumigena CCY9414]|nr:hypothetical protein NSP_13950 [Nodularia spumigena CCY9414]
MWIVYPEYSAKSSSCANINYTQKALESIFVEVLSNQILSATWRQ